MIYRLSNVLLPILLLFLYVSSEVKSCDLFFSLEALISPQKANCRSTLPDGSIGNYRCKASNCITTGNLYKLPAGRPYITFRKCKDTRTGKFEDVTYPNSYSLVGNHYCKFFILLKKLHWSNSIQKKL
ncbi:hypothetical protein BY996DRAFT_7831031 [Phakopsora pachyrhizi]|nr:hypothetical protein BY996DRAFT_7831031 [Phakopsora pachyrhizi]